MNRPEKYNSAPLYNELYWWKLLAGSQEDSTRAFDVIYNHYYGSIKRYLNAFSRQSGEEVDEIIQVVFARVWKQRQRLADIGNHPLYVCSMARNTRIDLWRKLKVRRAHERCYHTEAPDFENPETAILTKEYLAILWKTVKSMPLRRQTIFLLQFQQKESLDEIARQLGVSKEVVKKQLYYARKKIKEGLIGYGLLLKNERFVFGRTR